jgi:hypothetical protein
MLLERSIADYKNDLIRRQGKLSHAKKEYDFALEQVKFAERTLSELELEFQYLKDSCSA